MTTLEQISALHDLEFNWRVEAVFDGDYLFEAGDRLNGITKSHETADFAEGINWLYGMPQLAHEIKAIRNMHYLLYFVRILTLRTYGKTFTDNYIYRRDYA